MSKYSSRLSSYSSDLEETERRFKAPGLPSKNKFLIKPKIRNFYEMFLAEFTTRSLEKKNAELSSSKYVLANQVRRHFRSLSTSEMLEQTGDSPLHTAWYINEKGDKIWLKFDSSIPCNMFPTYETRSAFQSST